MVTMSVDAETYIVISLMFAVFAAVAAVGSSMVLGAGFERLRAGFELVRRQSGFFADAIHKLDQRTQKLDEETARLKAGYTTMGERVERVEKQTIFLGDAINSIESRILQGTPIQEEPKQQIRMQPVGMSTQRAKEWVSTPAPEQLNDMPRIHAEPLTSPLYRDFPEETPAAHAMAAEEMPQVDTADKTESSMGLTTLISKYWTGEQSGSGRQVVYH